MESLDLLMQPWPVYCQQCGTELGKAPLIAKALGETPSMCVGCWKKMEKWLDNPPTGCTITFNNWKGAASRAKE